MENVQHPCHIPRMAKHPKRPRDPAQLAKLIVDIATGEVQDDAQLPQNPMAIMGRVGGLKGGSARAKILSPARRKEIAKKAAQTRWAAHATKNENE